MKKIPEDFFNKISEIESKSAELEDFLSRSEVMQDSKLYKHFCSQKKVLEPCMALIQEYRKLEREFDEAEELLKLCDNADEKQDLSSQCEELKSNLKFKQDEITVLLVNESLTQFQTAEIEISGKSEEIISQFIDFVKLATACSGAEAAEENGKLTLSGVGIYDKFKNFSGKVKFVSRGREEVLTVMVLNLDTVKSEFLESDVEVQTLKSGGAGGQHINKTESAVRLVHIPTGISTVCQDERSQSSNKLRAMENLKSKVEEYYAKNRQKNIEIQRKNLKNAVFADTPSVVFDFDKNSLDIYAKKKSYKLSQILKGDMNLLFSEII